jgi:hypothetical protein
MGAALQSPHTAQSHFCKSCFVNPLGEGSFMQSWLIALLISVAVFLTWWWLRRRENTAVQTEPNSDRLDTLIGWPPSAARVLTTTECIVFGTLVRALPEYMILAQVPLSRFLSVPKRNSYADWLRRLGYQSVDFVVCDMTAQVVGVIEIAPAEHRDTERSRKRLIRITRSLKAAQIPLHVWSEKSLPSGDIAREALLSRSSSGYLHTPASFNAVSTVNAPQHNMFADTDAQPAAEDQLAPTPSTWFDELDSAATPLGKR